MIFQILFIIYSQANATSVNLLQETKEILCSENNSSFSIIIDAKDTKITTSGGLIYKATEFLDSGILLKNKKMNSFFQLTTGNKALFIEGTLTSFTEKMCSDTGASKTCSTKGGDELYWSPEKLKFNQVDTDVIHYGVHPNDGTYFIGALGSSAHALLDSGSKFQVISGSVKKLTCHYK